MTTTNSGSDEREFLHALATPLGTAVFLVDAVLDAIQSKAGSDPDEVVQITQIYDALERMKKLLQERREVLIKRGVPSGRP